MAEEPRPIYTFTDTAFECPECGRRLEFADPVGRDEDGDIYEGECLIHGMFLVQAVEEEPCSCGEPDCDFDCDGEYDATDESHLNATSA